MKITDYYEIAGAIKIHQNRYLGVRLIIMLFILLITDKSNQFYLINVLNTKFLFQC